MSIYDEFRSLSADLFDVFEAPPAQLLRRLTPFRTLDDRAAGRMTSSLTSIPCRALLGTRKVRNDSGTYAIEQVARLDVAPLTGDKLTLGSRSWEITSVQEVDPDGTGAIIFVAGLK